MKLDFNRIKRYIRDVSIVIIGIVVTFAGSGMINSWEKKKEVKEVMELISEELKDNITFMQQSIQSYQRDSLLLDYLMENEERIKEIPLDSLKQVKATLGHIQVYWYKKDAMELLKNASLMQYVKDKDVLLKLIQAYDILESLDVTMKHYSDYKYRIMTEPFETLPQSRQKRLWGEENVPEFFDFAFNNATMWNFINNAPGFMADPIHLFPEKVCEVVTLLDKKYGFN